MPTVRIWTVESDYDRDAVKCLANKLATYLHLDNLSIQASGRRALQSAGRNQSSRRNRQRSPSSDPLRRATQNYLEEAACVIFVIDQDSPMSTHQRRREPNSLINQIERVVNDPHFRGKVFLAWAVQELEAWLLIDCLGIFCYFTRQSPQYRTFDRDRIRQNSSFSNLVNHHQTGNTENIVEAVPGGRGAKEYLREFSEQILRAINPSMPQRNVNEKRYHESISPEVAEHIDINQNTLRRNNSLRRLGDVLTRFN